MMQFALVNKLNMQRYVRSTADLTALHWQSGKRGTDCLCLLTGCFRIAKLFTKWAAERGKCN